MAEKLTPDRGLAVALLWRLPDRLEGHWLKELAGVDARGAAGQVRTARALFRGQLAATAAHASVLAHGTHWSSTPMAPTVIERVVSSGAQRRADTLAELARRSLEGGRLPQTGGSALS